MNEPKLKAGDMAYATRHALTKGIVKVTVDEVTNDGWIRANVSYSGKEGGDFHASIGAAQRKARALAGRALKALDKKRATLETISRDGAKVIE